MSITNVAGNIARYDPVARLAHWLTFVLVAAEFALGWTMPRVTARTAPTGLIAAHVVLGSSILVLVLLRLCWRVTHAPPQLPALPSWQRRLSRATHLMLYVLLIAMPLAGWGAAAARGWTVRAFGLLPLPPLVPFHSTLGFTLGHLHAGPVRSALLALIALHVAGAAYHALIKRDSVLRRMLPAR